jgi:hypothetical protein
LLADVPAGPLQSLTVSALGYLQRVDGVLGGNPATLIQQLPIPLSAIPNLSAVIPQLNLPAGLGSTGSVPSIGSVLPSAGGKLLPTPLASPLAKVPKPITSLGLPSKLPTVTLPTTGSGGVTLPSRTLGGVLPSDNALTGVLANLGGGAAGGGADGGVTGSVGKTGAGSVGNTVTGVTGNVGSTVKGVTGSVGSTVKGVTGSVGSTAKGVTGSGGSGTGSGVTGTVGGVASGTVGTVTGGLTSSSGPALALPTAIPTLPPLPSLPKVPRLG